MKLYKTSSDKGISAESIYLKNGKSLEDVHKVEDKKTLISGIQYKKSAGVVEIFFNISAANITVPNGWTGLDYAKLPEGYKPSGNISKIIYCRKKGSISTAIPINLYIQTDGTIRFVNLTGAEITFENLIDYVIFSIA